MIPNARLQLLDGADGGWDCRDGGPPPAVVAIEQFLDSLALGKDDALRAPSQADGGLSHREAEVLGLIATGMSNQQIADDLVISVNTVAKHVANILNKTGTANRTEAASFARQHEAKGSKPVN